MSPKITSLKKAGLTALGLFGLAAFCVAEPGESAPSPQALSPASSTDSAWLLLSDGRLLPGKIEESELGYTLKWKGGTIPFRKSQVEKVFGSLEEVYQYKADQLPERDPDEQIKLAQWCMTNKLNRQAKTHLQAAAAMTKNDPQVTAMLTMVESQEERAAARESAIAQATIRHATVRDPDLMQAKAEIAEPAQLPLRRRGMPTPGLPRIFDLPTAMAVKRANEFDRFVHPVLQKYCAQCHNEQYPGEFQLIQIKTKRDRTQEVARVNLDATLRFVDQDSPADSKLLAATLRPHGNSPRKRPIFLGANDPAYQYLSNWVNSLRSSGGSDPAKQGRFALDEGASGDAFAADRTGDRNPTAKSATLSATPARPGQVLEDARKQPPLQKLPGVGVFVLDETPPSDADFPRSPLTDGSKPKRADPKAPPAQAGNPPSAVPAQIPVTGADLPAAATPGTPAKPDARDQAKPAPKPVKLNQTALDKIMKSRYGAPR